jgi:hypothetical protein
MNTARPESIPERLASKGPRNKTAGDGVTMGESRAYTPLPQEGGFSG